METRHCNDFGFQPSLQDSDILADLPATEVAGYFQTAAPAARAKKQVLRGAPSQGSVARLRMTNQKNYPSQLQDFPADPCPALKWRATFKPPLPRREQRSRSFAALLRKARSRGSG